MQHNIMIKAFFEKISLKFIDLKDVKKSRIQLNLLAIIHINLLGFELRAKLFYFIINNI